eukprot:14878028-Heterocapsa_arctica.AAC.1
MSFDGAYSGNPTQRISLDIGSRRLPEMRLLHSATTTFLTDKKMQIGETLVKDKYLDVVCCEVASSF